MPITSIAVFCGSKTGTDPLFEEEARNLGKLLASRKINLVYGGGNKGLMAAIANAVLDNGGTVTGIIPELLREQEHMHNTLTELHVTENMHARKKMLYDLCEAAIILPGGFGTLDEVFEILTWNQLRIHSKQIIFLNTNGFYDHLIAHIHRMHAEGLLYSHPSESLQVCKDTEELKELIG